MSAKKKIVDQLVMENVRMIFRNFSGKEAKYNPKGRRNFCVVIEDSVLADRLKSDGWNIRYLPARDENDGDTAYMQVTVSYDNIPPMIKTITSKGQTILDEETVSMLDWADIINVDLIISPYNWEVNGKSGVKAYVKSMYVTIEEDALAEKYDQPSLPLDE